MHEQIIERLQISLFQYLSAKTAGSSKTTITEGYQAVDNCISALILCTKNPLPKNHLQKINVFIRDYKGILQKNDLHIMRNYYKAWQDVRYSGAKFTPKQTLEYLRFTGNFYELSLNEVAQKLQLDKDELEKKLYENIIGSRWSKIDKMCSKIHNHWQDKAEEDAELYGRGSKLGNKMINPANFSDLSVFAEDDITRKLLEDEEIAILFGQIFNIFLRIIVKTRDKRATNVKEINEATNFLMSLRLSYYGESLDEIVHEWQEAFKKLKKPIIVKIDNEK